MERKLEEEGRGFSGSFLAERPRFNSSTTYERGTRMLNQGTIADTTPSKMEFAVYWPIMRTLNSSIAMSLAFFFSLVAAGQRPMTNQEIWDSWIRSHPARGSSVNAYDQLSFDTITDRQIKIAVSSLQGSGIDTFLVLVNSHPGTIVTDTCRLSVYPSEEYIFYAYDGKGYVRKVANKCGLGEFEMRSDLVFRYFDSYKKEISREFIKPQILSAERRDGRVAFSYMVSSDEDMVVLYYNIHGASRRFDFSESDIRNPESLFHSDNINSKVYEWFLKLQAIATQLETKHDRQSSPWVSLANGR